MKHQTCKTRPSALESSLLCVAFAKLSKPCVCLLELFLGWAEHDAEEISHSKALPRKNHDRLLGEQLFHEICVALKIKFFLADANLCRNMSEQQKRETEKNRWRK